MKKFEVRVNNIGLKYLQNRYEILQYYKNEYYYTKDDYEQVNENYYTLKNNEGYSHFINKSCFEHPESCLLLAHFNINYSDFDGCQIEFCGNRPLRLTKEEFEDFMDVVRYAYERIDEEVCNEIKMDTL